MFQQTQHFICQPNINSDTRWVHSADRNWDTFQIHKNTTKTQQHASFKAMEAKSMEWKNSWQVEKEHNRNILCKADKHVCGALTDKPWTTSSRQHTISSLSTPFTANRHIQHHINTATPCPPSYLPNNSSIIQLFGAIKWKQSMNKQWLPFLINMFQCTMDGWRPESRNAHLAIATF